MQIFIQAQQNFFSNYYNNFRVRIKTNRLWQRSEYTVRTKTLTDNVCPRFEIFARPILESWFLIVDYRLSILTNASCVSFTLGRHFKCAYFTLTCDPEVNYLDTGETYRLKIISQWGTFVELLTYELWLTNIVLIEEWQSFVYWRKFNIYSAISSCLECFWG